MDLNTEQREQAFVVLDAARPGMRRMRFAFADYRQRLYQLDPSKADYKERLQDIANEVSKLSGRLVMSMGETYAKVAALLTPDSSRSYKMRCKSIRGIRGVTTVSGWS